MHTAPAPFVLQFRHICRFLKSVTYCFHCAEECSHSTLAASHYLFPLPLSLFDRDVAIDGKV